MTLNDWFALEGNPFPTNTSLAEAICSMTGLKRANICAQLSAAKTGRENLSVRLESKIRAAIVARCGEELGQRLSDAYVEALRGESEKASNFQSRNHEQRTPRNPQELKLVHELEDFLGFRLPDQVVGGILLAKDAHGQ